MCIIRENILLIILHLNTIQMYLHHKPLAEKIWSERCTKNSIVLNDCNWCRCNIRQKYDCKARVCEEIDMFGHFKDAIQELDVGMEGHGSWRSGLAACTPGVHYRRGAVLCVCDEDGNWPNPVCRDLFQILHSVELTGQTSLSQNKTCTPTKLYLVGCNVCFCPSLGYLDPQMCTKRECHEDDPILETNQTPLLANPPINENDVAQVLEIYAMCDPKYKYVLGCRHCECLRNNRLLCDNCTVTEVQYPNSLTQRTNLKTKIKFRKPNKSRKPQKPRKPNKPKKPNKPNKPNKPSKPNNPRNPNRRNVCFGKKPLAVFRVDCNFCHCSRSLKMYCTIRKCIRKTTNIAATFKIYIKDSSQESLEHVEEPPDDESCKPGTVFNRDCNVCKCAEADDGAKIIKCTRETCVKFEKEQSKAIESQGNDCVPETYYQNMCMLCYCYVQSETKYQICRITKDCVPEIDQKLKGKVTLQGKILQDANLLSGYCRPMQEFKKGCNHCRCLSDGKSLECTASECSLRSVSQSVEIVPVVIENGVPCPKGHSYRIDCNLCFCLSNGNAICTTNNCSNQNKIT